MKKLAFVACLMVPLGLWLYGKVPGWIEAYAAKKVESAVINDVVRQIPLGKSQLNDAFKQLPPMPQMPTLVPPHAAKPVRVHPKAPPKPIPLPPQKPKVFIKTPPVKPVAPPQEPLQLEPLEQQPEEFCALSWLSVHCGFAPQ